MSKIYGIGDEEELAEDLQKELPNRIIDELEKIKTEIQEEIEDYLMEDDYIIGVKDGFLFSAEIVDKHIRRIKNDSKSQFDR